MKNQTETNSTNTLAISELDAQQIKNTLAFFRSAILSGEQFTETCQKEYDKAMELLTPSLK